MKIALTSVTVNNPVEAFTFYTEVLGFVKKIFVPEAALAIVASPEEPDGTGLLLEPNDNPIAKTFQEAVYQAGLPVIVFGTADIQKEYERLKALDVVFRKEPTKTDWGTEAIFEDTCGNLIQIAQA
jgi:catechol 2,3-dioxygenase-like lactoylglutathione lyase family enzyme